MKTRSNGFTLIELMITVAIVAILAAIAYPSYQDSIRKSRRADAKGALVQLAQYMERFYTLYGRYDQDTAGTAVALPFTQSPTDSSPKYYDLSLVAADLTQNSFTVLAVPIAGTDQVNDTCGNLSLTNTGVKTYTGTGVNCW